MEGGRRGGAVRWMVLIIPLMARDVLFVFHIC